MRTLYKNIEGTTYCLRENDSIKEAVPCSLKQLLEDIHNEWVFHKLEQLVKAAR